VEGHTVDMTKANGKTSRYKDFGKTQALDEYDPLGFKLNEEEFSCRPALAGAALLDFVRRADSESGSVAAEAIIQFLEDSLEEPDKDRFVTMIRDPEIIVEVETLGEIAGWLIEQYTTRPTKPRTRPSNGRSSIGRGSTDISSEEE
jgi:hypothetical protein